MESKQIAAAIEREFPVHIEWLGEKSFMIVFRPGWTASETERMRPKISARWNLIDERTHARGYLVYGHCQLVQGNGNGVAPAHWGYHEHAYRVAGGQSRSGSTA